jgi:hypothetical protein
MKRSELREIIKQIIMEKTLADDDYEISYIGKPPKDLLDKKIRKALKTLPVKIIDTEVFQNPYSSDWIFMIQVVYEDKKKLKTIDPIIAKFAAITGGKW